MKISLDIDREEFYLNEYESVKQLKSAIHAYIEFYNQKCWHQSLYYKKTPAQVYFAQEIEALGVVNEPFEADSTLHDMYTN